MIKLRGLVLLSCAILVAGEIAARHIIQQNRSVTMTHHPTIEYMLTPGQDLIVSGSRILVNVYGMRSSWIPAEKGVNEIRVMVFGDSVINGSPFMDHEYLATTRVAKSLSENGYDVSVGNVSAGSWGPGNWLSYVREFGFFESQYILLVISSHDYMDNPEFVPMHPVTMAGFVSPSALYDFLKWYMHGLMRRLQYSTAAIFSPNLRFEDATAQSVHQALVDLKAFLTLAKRTGAYILVLQHLEKSELKDITPKTGHQLIRAVCEEMGIQTVSLSPYLQHAIAVGIDPYRDNIHLNVAGQNLLAEIILKHLSGNLVQQPQQAAHAETDVGLPQ